MSHDKIGPREKALRDMREAKWAAQQKATRASRPRLLGDLKAKVAVASLKTGKSRKKK